MKPTYGSLALDRVDGADGTYRITTEEEVESLARSIESAGLINPPLLAPRGRNWVVVSGFRRIAACRHLGRRRIDAAMLPAGGSEKQRVRAAVADNAMQRPLNLIELSRALALLEAVCPRPERLPAEAAALGLPDHPAYLRKIRSVGRLSEPVQRGILADTISLPAALELEKEPLPAQAAFAALFDALRVSMNKQRDVITWVREIALREALTVGEVLAAEPLAEILTGDNPDRGRRAREVEAYLKRRRFPTLSRARERAGKLIGALDLGPGAALAPPPNFEGTVYRLDLRFTTREELAERRRALDRLLDDPLLERILAR